ncbi:hypothetical protein BJF78_33375 [Pseudonocardia sp. CNS-139]|nr:hypothetical protein BJF78_33375 [Pseudonocardia sp. CNS-139]
MTDTLPVEILVEEFSAELALRLLLPRIVPGVPFEIRRFQGKQDLLKKLPARLAGYATWPGVDVARIVVLVDRDDEDCRALRDRLDSEAAKAGFKPTGPERTVVNRIAVEELEAWFFGDVDAIVAAYPRVPVSTGSKAVFRDPDQIQGGTAEAFERLLQRHGYHKAGLAKASAAQDVATYMNVERNASASFQAFRDGVRRLAGMGGD